jgi:hypothetical protein
MANPEHLQILKQGVEAVRCSQHLTASKHPIPQAYGMSNAEDKLNY